MLMRFLTIVSMIILTSCGYTTASGEVRGGNLREIIENQIRDNVRESYGELEGQNLAGRTTSGLRRTLTLW